jgi:hypothetical protein
MQIILFFYKYIQEGQRRSNAFDQRKKQDSPCMRVLKLSVFQPQHTFDSTPAEYKFASSYVIQLTPIKHLGLRITKCGTYNDLHTRKYTIKIR